MVRNYKPEGSWRVYPQSISDETGERLSSGESLPYKDEIKK